MTIGIIGGGITGLALSHYLRARGVAHLCFETGDEPGGVIRSRRVDGRVLELGPQRLRAGPELVALLEELGLGGEVMRAPPNLPLYVYFGGRLREVPFSLHALLRTDLLTWRGKLRLLAEPLVKGRTEGEETVAEFFRRKFGDEASENFLGPLFGGIYGSDPRRMSARHALSRLLALEERSGSLLLSALRMSRRGGLTPSITFRTGLQALPEALLETNRESVHLGTAVRAIRAGNRGYTLVTTAGDVDVDRVVVTVPADQAAELLGQLAPAAALRLARLHYNALIVVHLHSVAQRKGLGYQIRGDQDFRTLGVTWNAGTFDRGGVYTCFLGGWKHPELIDLPDGEVGRIAREEFKTIMGEPAQLLHIHRWRRGIPAYDLTWNGLEAMELPPGIDLATNYTGGVGVSARVHEARRLAERLASGSR